MRRYISAKTIVGRGLVQYQTEVSRLLRRVLRLVICVAAVAIVTFVAYRVLRVNAPTVGFAYLILVLIIAGTWGFFEAALTSIAAALAFNRYFFEPIGTFTIYDPQNWVA